jgi:hypothetical protein
MVEFLIVLPVMMLLVLGILQFGLVYRAKVTLNYATFQTARTGALRNACVSAMNQSLARNLAALWTVEEGVTAVVAAKNRIKQEIENGYATVRVINPSLAAFSDHGVTGASGNKVIPNDNLMFRSAAVSGGGSKQSVQDANLLKIHVGYCYQLVVPFVNRILVRMMSLSPTAVEPANFGPLPSGSFAEACVVSPVDKGRYGMPIYSQAIMRMQSSAYQEADCPL